MSIYKGSLRKYFALGSGSVFGFKLCDAGLSLIAAILLARVLGPSGYGAYAFAIACAGFLVVPAVLGMNNLLVRHTAAYVQQSEWGLLRGMMGAANRMVLIASLMLAILAIIIMQGMAVAYLESGMLPPLVLAMLLLPILALASLRQAVLRGLHFAVRADLPELILKPLLFLLLLTMAYFMFRPAMDAVWAMALQCMAAAAAFAVGAWMLGRAIPSQLKTAVPVYHWREWMTEAWPLLLMGCLQVITNLSDMLILGVLKGAEETGVYAVAKNGAMLIAFVLAAVNAVLAPVISKLYTEGDMVRLQRVTTLSARMILLFSLFPALALIFFGDMFLQIFGPDFVEGETALTILCIAQIINATMGSVGLLLIMTGHAREALWGMAIGAIIALVLNLVLIPNLGGMGAAIASACSLAGWNIAMAVWVYRRLGIRPGAMAKLDDLGHA
ncbi:MAG: flippase [Mariprofundus sp.]